MKKPVKAPPLAGRVIGPADGDFVLAEWSDKGETSAERPIAPLHVHHRDDEAWYVLEGKLGFRLGDEDVVANAGSAVFAPRGLPHTYWNAHKRKTRYVIVMTPNLYGLIEEIHATNDRDAASMRRLFERYDSELL